MMELLELKVNIEPSQAVNKLISNNQLKTALVFEEHKIIKDSKYELFIMVFEKYYLRTNSTASLTVTVDNLNGATIIKCISTGSSAGMFMLSFGAGKDFIKIVKTILETNIEDIIRES
jgi:hypothetical protein